VTNSGVLTLNNPTITTTGSSSSMDNSSFYGLNAGLLVTAAGSATVTGGTVIRRRVVPAQYHGALEPYDGHLPGSGDSKRRQFTVNGGVKGLPVTSRNSS
jgi:hypothetical protein